MSKVGGAGAEALKPDFSGDVFVGNGARTLVAGDQVMKVKQAMQGGPDWAGPNTSLLDIAKRMRDEDIGAIPIVEGDELVGMVTDRDIVVRGVASRTVAELTARDVMSAGVVWCSEDDDVDDAARIMREQRVRRIPVMDNQRHLIGMLSVGDITSASSGLAGDALRRLSSVGD